jgi:hypothetical protein
MRGFGEAMARNKVDPGELDDGIRDTVVMLWKAGFKTFTSCEGGKGHSFRYATIGLQLQEDYSDFHRRLVGFLKAQGMQTFSLSLMTDYHPRCPQGKQCVYLEGLDLLSEAKRKNVIDSLNRRERKLKRQLRELGIED